MACTAHPIQNMLLCHKHMCTYVYICYFDTFCAGEAGLRLSLLERLAGSAPYSAAEQHPTAAAGLIVKLVRNYRCARCCSCSLVFIDRVQCVLRILMPSARQQCPRLVV